MPGEVLDSCLRASELGHILDVVDEVPRRTILSGNGEAAGEDDAGPVARRGKLILVEPNSFTRGHDEAIICIDDRGGLGGKALRSGLAQQPMARGAQQPFALAIDESIPAAWQFFDDYGCG